MAKNGVWELAKLPPGRRAITCKWMFKAKRDETGNVNTYKARLVARGFVQQEGKDYDETFAPVVRHETVHVLFVVAAAAELHVRQLDVTTAYLNGQLDEELYLSIPPGFAVDEGDGMVLRWNGITLWA